MSTSHEYTAASIQYLAKNETFELDFHVQVSFVPNEYELLPQGLPSGHAHTVL